MIALGGVPRSTALIGIRHDDKDSSYNRMFENTKVLEKPRTARSITTVINFVAHRGRHETKTSADRQ